MKSFKHNLSYDRLQSFNCGELVPVGCLEVLPGDRMDHATSALLRTQPLLAPVMHKVEAKIHHWFVPTRLLWDKWEDFITGGPDGDDVSVVPTINTPASTGFAVGSLADYLGVPPTVASRPVLAFPFRAYALIWNEFYRDQDLQTPVAVSTGSGTDSTTNTSLLFGGWQKDYFTSARPEPQKGSDVIIPLNGNAPVVPDAAGAVPTYKGAAVTNKAFYLQTDGIVRYPSPFAGTNVPAQWDDPNLAADLSNVSAVDMNELRFAAALQRFKENMMRYGSRYVERLMQYGVRPQDSRLQLPEYLGGGSNVIQFSEVLQTAEGTDPVGELRGHGIGGMRSNRYRRFVPEHGYIISVMVVRPKTMYPQGLFRMWNRRSRLDWWQPEFQHIGQQEVLNKEVYFKHTNPDGTFGWQDRYDEYRYQESSVHGEFRDTLDFWHMARIFASDPALNADFVKSNPTNRIYATDADQLQVRVMHKIINRRLVSATGRSFLY